MTVSEGEELDISLSSKLHHCCKLIEGFQLHLLYYSISMYLAYRIPRVQLKKFSVLRDLMFFILRVQNGNSV